MRKDYTSAKTPSGYQSNRTTQMHCKCLEEFGGGGGDGISRTRSEKHVQKTFHLCVKAFRRPRHRQFLHIITPDWPQTGRGPRVGMSTLGRPKNRP